MKWPDFILRGAAMEVTNQPKKNANQSRRQKHGWEEPQKHERADCCFGRVVGIINNSNLFASTWSEPPSDMDARSERNRRSVRVVEFDHRLIAPTAPTASRIRLKVNHNSLGFDTAKFQRQAWKEEREPNDENNGPKSGK